MKQIEIDSDLSYDIIRNEYTIVNVVERVAVIEDNFKKFMLKSSIIGITSKIFPIINN